MIGQYETIYSNSFMMIQGTHSMIPGKYFVPDLLTLNFNIIIKIKNSKNQSLTLLDYV